MNTKLLMSISALLMGFVGITLTFLPQEILLYLKLTPVRPLAPGLQLTGALYLSFGLLNWMAKASLIGGIYNRPLAMGNFLHFFMGAILFIKAGIAGPSPALLWVACIIYSSFALLFGFLLFSHPLKQNKSLKAEKA